MTEEAQLILTRALNGSIEDQFALATLLEEGVQMERDPRTAAGWYEKAALKGHVNSMYRLGLLQLTIDHGDADCAFYWLGKAAEAGVPHAKYLLSLCYETGVGCAPDHARSLSLCREAAQAGDPDAKQKLREMDNWFVTGEIPKPFTPADSEGASASKMSGKDDVRSLYLNRFKQ